MTPIKALITVALGLWLAGCATSGPAPSRYTLPMEPGRDPTDVAGVQAAHRLLVEQPRLARFLEVDGLVLQLDDITLNEANHHRWAEPLVLQLERGLRARLAARLPDTRVMQADTNRHQQGAPTLRLTVDAFHGRFDGRAVAAGQWQLRGAEGELLAMSPFAVEVELTQDGYPALVRALGRSWDQVAEQIATDIKRLR
ncbi:MULTISPECIES: PqiC family protein [Halomonas]|uniref:ABC-type transport auxiliary lipoprotein component domain-containing protein n=1 Tax=Halomonas ventosae TaxID=229007 RepID=A0A4V3C1E3_9GAMM|nr:ABC-type transport auxiliary lipoprotein family protein [Halomonas ventosae]TDO13959.1 hypothetical protein DFO68_103184 [Halomonas ventosae]